MYLALSVARTMSVMSRQSGASSWFRQMALHFSHGNIPKSAPGRDRTCDQRIRNPLVACFQLFAYDPTWITQTILHQVITLTTNQTKVNLSDHTWTQKMAGKWLEKPLAKQTLATGCKLVNSFQTHEGMVAYVVEFKFRVIESPSRCEPITKLQQPKKPR